MVTRPVWQKLCKELDLSVAAPNGRTRAWGMTKGPKDDKAYAAAVLAATRKRLGVEPTEIYLAGFSSGSDFLCKAGLQKGGRFAGSLIVCPGPSHVLGLRGGELLEVKDHPFFFLTGEEDYIRKGGAFEAFMTLDKAGGRAIYREVPGVGHSFPGTAEYRRAFELLRRLAGKAPAPGPAALLAEARAAMQRGDYLLASDLCRDLGKAGAPLRKELAKRGAALAAAARQLDFKSDPGRAYETWWKVYTQFYRFEELHAEAGKALRGHGIKTRDLYRARRDYFRSGGARRDRQPAPERRKDPESPRQPQVRRPAPRPTARVTEKAASARGPWAFDEYLSYTEVSARLQRLAAENPQRVRLQSMGKSVQGRDLWVCTITADPATAAHKPAIYVQGGIHGNEISSVMVSLYFAWQLGANPDRRRGIDRLLRDYTLYVAPAINPDAIEHFVTRPNSLWRPRFNFAPHDADGDGRVDENPYQDLNGDGQISQMYVADPKGPFVLRDGRMVRPRRGEEQAQRFRHLGREGLDLDGDGKVSEDPIGGVNLNRNFPVGHRSRRDYEGHTGAEPASEPETRAVIDFVTGHPNINLFFDYHNAANCVFYWCGPDGQRECPQDFAEMTGIAGRARKALGFAPRPLNHKGVGLSIAWAYGALGIPACIVELEKGRPEDWGEDGFIKARPFDHPQFGKVWIGNDSKKLNTRNPPPSGIYAQCTRHWLFLREELKRLPRLKLEQPKITAAEDGFVVRGRITNHGQMPLDSQQAQRLGKSAELKVSVEGAEVDGDLSLGSLAVGASVEFRVRLRQVGEHVDLHISHPRGGRQSLAVLRPRIATRAVREARSYAVQAGYGTPDKLAGITLAEDKGPRFAPPAKKRTLRVAVLLGEFEDLRHEVPREAFRAAYFGTDYRDRSYTGQPVYGSVRDFYREMSMGQLDVQGEVFAWETLPGRYEDYRKASFGSSRFRTALEAAVLARHGDKALDGFDGLVFVWAGNPVHRVSCLWPMRVNLKHRKGVIAFKTGEFYKGQMAAIGVACHELGHTFGVNDKYGLGAPELPLGRFCLMGKGTHGHGASMQHRPFHLCAWCKSVIGWLEPKIIRATTKPQKLALRPVTAAPGDCLRVLLKDDGSEYLLLTNRAREGFFTELPSRGLVVLRVGPDTRPSAPQKQVLLLPAHGLGPARRSELQRLEEICWPQEGKDELVVDGVRLGDIRILEDVVHLVVERR